MATIEPKLIGEIVGHNVRRLRDAHGISMDQLARHARGYGLKWNTGRVYDIEHGAIPVTVPLLLTLTAALAEASGQELRITDLTDGIDDVQLNDDARITTASLHAALAGQSTATWGIGRRKGHDLAAAGLTDRRVANDLGLALRDFADVSNDLWGRTFTEERDQRAGPSANAQKRGRIARQLKAEIQQALADRTT